MLWNDWKKVIGIYQCLNETYFFPMPADYKDECMKLDPCNIMVLNKIVCPWSRSAVFIFLPENQIT